MKERVQLYIVSYSFPPEWAGPVERYLRYVPFLKEREIDVHFVTRKLNSAQLAKENVRGAEVTRLDVQKSRIEYEYFLWKAGWWLKRNTKPGNVVIYLSYSYPLIIQNMFLRKNKVPTVALHSMAVNHNPKGLKNRFFYYLGKQGVLSCKRAISSTEYLKQNLLRYGFKEDDIFVSKNGVDTNRFKPLSEYSEKIRLEEELDIPRGIKILFVGLKTPRKGVLELLQAWNKLRADHDIDGHLLLVGGDRRENRSLESFYEEFDMEMANSTNVLDLGSQQNVEQYFQVCDVFVFLSNLEGLPNVLPEAMATGIPILMNKYVGFSSDVAIENEHFIGTNLDIQNITDKLYILIQDREKRINVAENALKWINETQEINKVLDRLCFYLHESI